MNLTLNTESYIQPNPGPAEKLPSTSFLRTDQKINDPKNFKIPGRTSREFYFYAIYGIDDFSASKLKQQRTIPLNKLLTSSR